MKGYMRKWFIAAMMLFSSLACAETGLLFQITESGLASSIDIILCLNGKGPLSCQNYHVSAQNLSIITAANHDYPAAGIKVKTPGYQLTGCTEYSNGYCLFAVSRQTPAFIQITSTKPYSVGGTVSGLVGSVSLQNNGGDTLVRNANGSFTFNTLLTEDTPYNVTVSSQPATQTCTVINGSGVMGVANVTNIQVTCATNTYTVGGTISGLSGTVSLQNNGSDTLTRNADGSFTFATPVAQGSTYNVTVSAQPAIQTCVVSNGSGTMGSGNVTNVQVTCTTNSYTVGGTVSGLIGSVSLQNNGGDTLTRNADGSFTFATPVAQGSTYNVTVSAQPATQTCMVSNGSGTMGSGNVTNVQVTCTTNTYTVGGAISGLSGTVSLQNNGSDTLTQNADGSFTFSTPVAQGSTYNVTVSAQPATQTCVVSNGSGTMGSSNVTNVMVICTTNFYTVGGTVSGLSGTVSLQNNGGDTLTQNADGLFVFATPIAQGSTYNVTVSAQPATQTCVVSNGSGTVGSGNVTNVLVTCTTNTYTVGGRISGLIGSVSLQNNGGDTLVHSSDGRFTFSTPIVEGDTYNVTVSSQPATQTCSVSNGTGTMGSSNVTNIQVTCSVNFNTVGGTITGLVGSVSLQNNGTDTLTRNANGSFTFSTPVAEGSPYTVTVSAHPAAQTCTVNNGTGTMGGANVTNVQVICATNAYTVGGVISGLFGTLSLQNNGTFVTRSTDGSYVFPTPVAEGSSYDVTVRGQPSDQSCTVSNGTGVMGAANVTNVNVNCVSNTITTLSVSATGTIPVPVGSGTITVTNTGTLAAATNVSVVLPSGWSAVTQDATNCTSIPPNNGTCVISFTSLQPYVAQSGLEVIGDNVTNTPTTTLGFTVSGYYVWAVTDALTAQVIDTADLSTAQDWGPNNITGATSLTNGVGNTLTIDTVYGFGASSAGGLCYNNTAGGVPLGTWYLPAICQLGQANQLAGCATGLPNIETNLVLNGLVSISGSYWSSTEATTAPQFDAWLQFLAPSGGTQTIVPKDGLERVRCARSIVY